MVRWDLPAVAEAGSSTDCSAHSPAATEGWTTAFGRIADRAFAAVGLGAHWPTTTPSTDTVATWWPMPGSSRRVSRTPWLSGSTATVNWLYPPAPKARPSSVTSVGLTWLVCGNWTLSADTSPLAWVSARVAVAPGARFSAECVVVAPGRAG